jgi:hypothetical protein
LKGELFINYSPLSGKNAKTGEEAGKEAGVAFASAGRFAIRVEGCSGAYKRPSIVDREFVN